MIARLKRRLLSLLRVPAEPRAALGDDGREATRVFRAAPAFFRYKLALWVIKQGSVLVGLLFGLAFAGRFVRMVDDGRIGTLILLAEAAAWAVFLVQLPISYAVMRLDFEMRWYILSDRSLRIREGVLHLQEKTMTFANIQQITIRRNPLQALFGIADVRVRTAGGGSNGGSRHGEIGESSHEAFFRGVDTAEEIRSAIRERVRLHRDSGLGDPDEPAARSVAPTGPAIGAPGPAGPGVRAAVDAARELREEVRALRSELTPRRT